MAFDTEIMNSVRELTNKELFQRLQGLGFNIGPVTRTTRSVYEKKLYKALTGQLPSPTKEVIGDQPCIRGDDEDVGEEDENDDDSDESSFFKRNAMKGLGDFSGSSRLVVEDSFEEDADRDNSFLNERFEPNFESSLNVSSIQSRTTDNDFSIGDLDVDDDIPDEKWVTLRKGRLYPELEKPPEVSEERVEYYLKKYGPDESDNSFDDLNFSMDTSELRRRPLHSVREVKKTYPASFIKVDMKRNVKEPEKVTPLFADTPTFEDARPYNHIPKASNGIHPSYNPPKSNGISATKIVEDKRPPFDIWGAMKSPVGIVAMILLLFLVLVFLSIEPQQELPKLLIPTDEGWMEE